MFHTEVKKFFFLIKDLKHRKEMWLVKIEQDWNTVGMVESSQRTTIIFVAQKNILVLMQGYKFSILAAFTRLCGACKENLFGGHFLL